MKKSRKIKYKKPIKLSKIKYKNALNLALDIELKENEGHYCIVAGDFIFGDFIEAFIHEWDFSIKEITFSTLSLSENNVDNIANIIKAGHVDKVNLIVSDFFYAHERTKIMKYIDQVIGDKITLGIARTHMKITQFETKKGNKVVIHGSANLRSSQNIEQIIIEENKSLYDFNKIILDEILTQTKTKGKLTLKETESIIKNF